MPTKIPYTKKALSFSEQLEQLKTRGLAVDNEERAKHYLQHINYYRLSAYIYPFLKGEESNAFKKDHLFKESTTFQNILDIYLFDRELRLLVLDAIERIEISFRTNIIYVLSHKHNPFWLSNKDNFYIEDRYIEQFTQLKGEIKRSDEKFIEHFKNKYSDEIPPAWISLEMASFGLVSLLYQNLKNNRDKKEIAQRYGLTHIVFSSWLHSLVYLRNVSAHHSRLWNRELGIQPAIPKSVREQWLETTEAVRNDRVFYLLSIIIYFLNIINPSSSFKRKLHELLEKYPMVDLAPMGFPKNWKEEELFKTEKQ